MKDIIYIEDLRVKTIIGIFDWERETKQEVSIDIEFPFDCMKAAKNDSIEDTLDYKKICNQWSDKVLQLFDTFPKFDWEK